jgi:diguanylate cyclase (GGDEF)-like protein
MREYRLGGDEFVLVLTNLADNHDYESVVKRVLAEMNTRFVLNPGSAVTVSASVGIALYHDDSTANELLRQADHAMYQAKLLGRNRFTHFCR